MQNKYICINTYIQNSLDIFNYKEQSKFQRHMKNLTKDAIKAMLAQQNGNTEFFVNLLKIRKAKSSYITCLISDGIQSFKGLAQINDQAYKSTLLQKDNENGVKIKIKRHITHHKDDKPIAIELVQFQIVKQEVRPKHQYVIPHKNIKKEFKSQLTNTVKNQFSNTVKKNKEFTKREFPQTKPKQKQIQKLQIKDTSDNEQQQAQTRPPPDHNTSFDINAFEKITDLYENMNGWQILVRLIDKSYRQFINKKGLFVRILELQFIDRTGHRINGTFFGQLAHKYSRQNSQNQSLLQKGLVYRISRGIIKQQNLTNNLGTISNLTLIFNKQTQIIKFDDLDLIPNPQSTFTRILNIQNETQDRFVSIVAVIVEIMPQKEISKQDRTFCMQNIVIGDPITRSTMDVVVWNKHILLDTQMLKKSFIFKHFKTNRFKEQLKLQTTYKSEVASHQFFKEFQNNTISYYAAMPKISNNQILSLAQMGKNFKHFSEDQGFSEIKVWISKINFDKKWFYEACPKCKKGTKSDSKCLNCRFYVTDTAKRYILSIELTDMTGSITVTAFQQAISAFLGEYQIDHLIDLQNDQLRGIGDKNSYKSEYIIKILSKKDDFGIKHTTVGRILSADVAQTTRSNLKKIRQLLKQP